MQRYLLNITFPFEENMNFEYRIAWPDRNILLGSALSVETSYLILLFYVWIKLAVLAVLAILEKYTISYV